MTGNLNSFADRVRAAFEPAREAVAADGRILLAAERADWPVKSGRSARALDINRTRLGFKLTNSAPYTRLIVSRGDRPWDRLVSALIRRMQTYGVRRAGKVMIAALVRHGR